MESLPRFFIELTLRGLALLVVAGAAALALRKAQPAVRHAIWTAAVAGMLLLPVLQTGIPGWTFPVWVERAANVPHILDVTGPQVVNDTATLPTAPGRPPARPVNGPVNGYVVLLGIYLAGASALLIRQARSSLTLRRLLTRARSVEIEGLAAAAQAVGFTGRLPEVRESREVRVPFTYGVSAPLIVLPDDWREWSDPKRLAVLAHETAHVARRDWLAGRIATVNRALNWWNPAAWWLERHLAALAEEAVDEAALAAVGDVKHYASAVVDFAIAMQGLKTGSMEATAMARSTKVGRRVERILASQGAGASGLKRGVFAMVAAVAAPLILVAASALPEVRQVGPNKPLMTAIQAPAAPEVKQQISATLPAGASQQTVNPTEVDKSIAQFEALLAQDPNNAMARYALMNGYRSAGEIEKARQHAWWLIENAPDQPHSFAAVSALIEPGPMAVSESGRQRVQAIWRSHAKAHASNPKVLALAGQVAMRLNSFFESEELILAARKLDPEGRGPLTQLAGLYLSALPGMRSIPSSIPQAAAFQAKAVSELETTTDAQLLGLAGEMLTTSQTITVPGNNPEQEAALRERLKRRNEAAVKYLKRALALEPENSRWRIALERAFGEPQIVRVPAPEPGVKRITVGGNVQRAMLVKSVQPEYPVLAKQARIQGTVRFSVVIGTDGTIKQMTLLGGHPLLVQAATEAVRQWVYNRTLLNGEPVEVATDLDVAFGLPETASQTEVQGEVHRIGGGVSAPVPIYRIEPAFPSGVPPEMQEARVLLAIVIDREGGVTNVRTIRGDPAFFEAAIEAVKQWKFKPGMKESQPVNVHANVEMTFRRN